MPVDEVWTERPAPPSAPLRVLDLKYVGRSSAEKVEVVRKAMKAKSAHSSVFTALDDIAYLFNLRGSDIAFNPVFLAYAIVGIDDVVLYVDDRKVIF